MLAVYWQINDYNNSIKFLLQIYNNLLSALSLEFVDRFCCANRLVIETEQDICADNLMAAETKQQLQILLGFCLLDLLAKQACLIFYDIVCVYVRARVCVCRSIGKFCPSSGK